MLSNFWNNVNSAGASTMLSRSIKKSAWNPIGPLVRALLALLSLDWKGNPSALCKQRIDSNTEEFDSLLELKIDSFHHFHMAEIVNKGMGLHSMFMSLHPLTASGMEGKEILLNPKWAARFCQIIWDWRQRRKMCKLFSVFDLQRGHMAGPHQFLFWRFYHVRFLLWKANQAKIMIFSGQPVFHKDVGKIWSISSKTKFRRRW